MTKKNSIESGDARAAITVRSIEVLGHGYRLYERHHFEMKTPDGTAVIFDRDVVRVGDVVSILPVDLARQEIVLIRQFRMAAHLATGRGELVEIAAGRVDPGEEPRAAALRECREETALVPLRAAHLATFLVAPAFADERMSLWLAEVDASDLRAHTGQIEEGEYIEPFRLGIDEALRALHADVWRSAPLIIALQWLALNRDRLEDVLRAGAAR